MKTLFVNLRLVNVFTDRIEETRILVDGGRITGVGNDYTPEDAENVTDLGGRYVCPGFIDSHIHIESSMLLPAEFTKVCLPHGTTAVVADPHEIANVCGTDGIRYMLQASGGLPLKFYYMLPSCVPATPFDESAAVLTADQLDELYKEDGVLGLAEMMDYPGVTMGNEADLEKIRRAESHGKLTNGHAPLLRGKALDRYISAGITDDHECTDFAEALEKMAKGQRILIREGTSARNLEGLLPLFDEPWNRRCMLCTDDKHPADLLKTGHIDSIIRKAASLGKDPVKAIRMATIQAAEYYGLRRTGAVAPGYRADFLVLGGALADVNVEEVYIAGEKAAEKGQLLKTVVSANEARAVDPQLREKVGASFHLEPLTSEKFHIEPEMKIDPEDTVSAESKMQPDHAAQPDHTAQPDRAVQPNSTIQPQCTKCRVIRVLPSQLLTEEWITEIDLSKNNGIDIDRDIIKIAVCERHNSTGHIGLGYIAGMGMKKGAIASSVSHDSHNIVVIGTSEHDMAFAAERIREIGGGCVVAENSRVLAELRLPVAGLMSDRDAETVAEENERLRRAAESLGTAEGIEPFMNTAFASLCVIPALKMSPNGLVDVTRFRKVSLFV